MSNINIFPDTEHLMAVVLSQGYGAQTEILYIL